MTEVNEPEHAYFSPLPSACSTGVFQGGPLRLKTLGQLELLVLKELEREKSRTGPGWPTVIPRDCVLCRSLSLLFTVT